MATSAGQHTSEVGLKTPDIYRRSQKAPNHTFFVWCCKQLLIKTLVILRSQLRTYSIIQKAMGRFHCQ